MSIIDKEQILYNLIHFRSKYLLMDMNEAIKETQRRREIQEKYNLDNGIVPKTIIKENRRERPLCR